MSFIVVIDETINLVIGLTPDRRRQEVAGIADMVNRERLAEAEAARETAFRDGQNDALRQVITKLEQMLMELPGISPEYKQTLVLARWCGELQRSITDG